MLQYQAKSTSKQRDRRAPFRDMEDRKTQDRLDFFSKVFDGTFPNVAKHFISGIDSGVKSTTNTATTNVADATTEEPTTTAEPTTTPEPTTDSNASMAENTTMGSTTAPPVLYDAAGRNRPCKCGPQDPIGCLMNTPGKLCCPHYWHTCAISEWVVQYPKINYLGLTQAMKNMGVDVDNPKCIYAQYDENGTLVGNQVNKCCHCCMCTLQMIIYLV
eukprot:m.192375 g.192375  ORF g.192375 m.192375 type:complete len:216 (+) comp15652_c0_seq28:421-1068(+)